MVVECEQIDATRRQPLSDFGFGVEVEGLVAQVEAGIRGQLRPQRLDPLEQLPRIVGAAQPRLPGPGRRVIDRGDAIGDCLPVAVEQRHVDGKIYARTWHHLPLEGIAVQIDDFRQNLDAACIDGNGTACLLRAYGGDVAAGDPQRGLKKGSAEKGPAAFDRYLHHDTARLCCE